MFIREEISPNWKKKISGPGDFLTPTLLDLWTCSDSSHFSLSKHSLPSFVLGTKNNSGDIIHDKVPVLFIFIFLF